MFRLEIKAQVDEQVSILTTRQQKHSLTVMQSRLPKIRRSSLDHSTGRQRTRSRAGYQ